MSKSECNDLPAVTLTSASEDQDGSQEANDKYYFYANTMLPVSNLVLDIRTPKKAYNVRNEMPEKSCWGHQARQTTKRRHQKQSRYNILQRIHRKTANQLVWASYENEPQPNTCNSI